MKYFNSIWIFILSCTSINTVFASDNVESIEHSSQRELFTYVHPLEDTSKGMRRLYKLSSTMEWFIVYFPVPYGSYSKETDFLFGLTKYNAFTMRRGNKQDSITQPSSVSGLGYYTLNSQYKMVVESNLMLNKNKAIWKTSLINTSYPLLFYGIGNETDLNNERTLNSSNFQISMQYLFRIWRKWYLGPAYDYYYYYDVDLAEGSRPLPGDEVLLRNNLGHQSGLGLKLSMEGRDNRLNAKKGFFVDASYQIFDQAIGSHFNYKFFQMDVRYYTTPFKKITIATQLRVQSKQGEVPVQSLCLLGGDYSMRGAYLGRYRDKILMDSQVEVRFPLFWIIGGTIFGGAGQVAPKYQEINLGSFHGIYGAGLRLKVDSKHDINLRVDMGFSKDQQIFIMNFAEAF